ncbi:MAG: hypothetical protein JWO18_2560, partial [Microbacteriaceae bacterium]|nr:hypothetical protein [Microbacteriaceae bacterium]
VIIIGILAAIAIPIYIGVQNNAKDSAVKSDLANAKTAVVAHATSNNGTIVTALTSLDPADGYTAPTASNYATSGIPAITVTGSSFCIVATSVTSSVFHVSDTGGVATGACP